MTTTASSGPYGFAGEAVQAAHEIERDWADAGLRGGFCARNIDTGEELGFGADTPYALASVSKVPLALVTLDLVARGELDAAQQLDIDPATATHGPTGVAAFRHPSRIALEDLLYMMLAVSDNAAADAVFELVPPVHVTRALQEWGCGGIVVRHPMRVFYEAARAVAPDDPALALELAVRATTDGGGHVLPTLDIASATRGTARGLVALFARIWTDAISVPAATGRLRELLGQQASRHRMVAELTTDSITVRSKTGTFLNLRHEAGVVETSTGDRIAVAALTASTVAATHQPEAERAIGRAARAAVDVLRL
ncbi:beta-lactamase class A [Haloactinopolyspora alba]|uniref:Beta-lactamase class A n=1 Tax=Haloactinopolyspora alba TaxID=648780 RepID=A0A2P8DEC5_9ACTN|nr:serine hydrolase [Haloactinopolyspora alba]PSK95555.1 beta-lactamase class A [Haloactinopolyspora alba]